MQPVSKRVGRAMHWHLGPSVEDPYSPSDFISKGTALSISEVSYLLTLAFQAYCKLCPELDKSLYPIRSRRGSVVVFLWRGLSAANQKQS